MRAKAEAVGLVVLAYAYSDDGDDLETIGRQGDTPDGGPCPWSATCWRRAGAMTTTTEPTGREGLQSSTWNQSWPIWAP